MFRLGKIEQRKLDKCNGVRIGQARYENLGTLNVGCEDKRPFVVCKGHPMSLTLALAIARTEDK
jgi:hypothetical protein